MNPEPSGHDLTDKRVTSDSLVKGTMAARAAADAARRELAAVTKDRNDLLLEYTALQAAKYPVPPKPVPRKRRKEDFVRVIANDVHGQMMDRDAVEAFLRDLKEWDADEIVLNGDIVECGGFLATHHTLGYVAQTEYSFQEDIAAGNWFLDEIQKAAPRAKIHYIEGNHECLHPDHEVLTDGGWKPIAEVTTEDTVATMTPQGVMVWQKPTHIHAFDFEGEMVRLESPTTHALMTPNHRVAFYGQGKGRPLQYRRADSMVGACSADVPTSARSSNAEYQKYSDDEIRLTAWVLTDGHLTCRVGISQSKPENVKRIESLMDKLEVRYSKRTRQRDIKEICGVALKSCMPSVDFDISASSARDYIAPMFGIHEWNHTLGNCKKMPDWIRLLSDRQFDVFLDEVMLADGSPCSDGKSKSKAVYGSKDFLSDLQAECVTHGYRASLRSRNRNGIHDYWVLNLTPRDNVRTEGRHYSSHPYQGKVHCLTTPSSNFFTRYKGSVHVTGNCRIERWIVDQTMRHGRDSAFLRTLLAPETLLRLSERGVLYYGRDTHHISGLPPGWIKLGKIFFVHELGGGKNAASAAVGRTAGNVVYAHTHVADTSTTVLPGVGLVAAWNPGCLCQRTPLWRNSNPTGWSHGYAVQFVNKSEEFLHVNVSIWNGKSLVGQLINKIKG